MFLHYLNPSPVPDPYEFQYEGHPHILEFYDYRGPLDPEEVWKVLLLAQQYELRHPGEELVNEQALHYTVGNVQLLMYPEEDMIWWDWYFALIDIKTFVKRKPFFYGWSLIIISRDRMRMVGRAWMVDLSRIWVGQDIGQM
ncbi:MAG: hypothetical protein Q9188_001518 [Gyalolechia gomerana]